MNLNHHDIHEIFSQISQSLNCPQCHSQILPHRIKITDIVENECLFDVNCHKCNAEMTLSAHIEKNINDSAKTYNKSSQIIHDNIVDESVTETDVKLVKEELKHFCGSFIEAFCRY
jgi:DNA-directed RNA polymerase subunit M/transcription elongation factor TFIIS